jgi:hypothetical protein
VLKAWNARQSGDTREKLQLPRGGLRLETFPRPMGSPNEGDFDDRDAAAS